MKRTSALSGIVGIIFLLFAGLGYILTAGGFASLFSGVNLLAGIIAIAGWLVSSRGTIGTMAGARTTRYGTNAAVYTIAFLGVLVAVNYLSVRYHRQFDLTAQNAFSLSPQSIEVIKALKQPVKLYGFVEAGRNPEAEALYEEYAYESPLITYELVDPNRHPELAERYKVTVMNTTHIQYGSDQTGSGTNVSDMSEQAITNGIVKVTSAQTKTVCFLTGEGEDDPDDNDSAGGLGQFRDSLQGESYKVDKINLVTQDKVPENCAVVVVAGPTRPLVPQVIDALNNYLKGGGRALVMLKPQPDQTVDESALVKFAQDWGVKAGNNVVVDQVERLEAGPALGLNPVVNTYNPHPITASFDKQTVFPMVRTVDPVDPAPPGLAVTALAKTSDTSWAETDLDGIFKRQTAKFDGNDVRGPVVVADAVQANLAALKLGTGEARLVVLGDTDVANNQYIGNFFNRDFIMNCVDWLAGESNSITIRPGALRASRFNLTVQEFDVVFVLSVLLLPELLLIIGFAVWWERRN
jgi:ABC-type uncharacterized transport system involved in gliding motility auxiliary subunit